MDTPEHRIFCHVQSVCSVYDVGEVKVHYVVTSDDIGVDFNQEVAPGLQKSLLIFEGVYLRPHYRSTCTQSKHVSHQWLSLTMHFHYVCYLDYRIRLCLRELALFGGALNIKGENSERRNLRMLTLAWQAFHIIEVLDIQLILRVAEFVLRAAESVGPGLYTDP